ncbi:SMI1/KNR4 family protein [Paraherbaspirillum soli]|uniref:SMI1/KNR4 family protein n=1 Tax=Paraherbaspirillum soli TaxID=631222 RepID=A0ABW0M5W6_9BURK
MNTVKIVDVAPSINNDELNEIEARLGILFPEDLRQHFLHFNGGRPVPNLFPKDDEYFPVHEFLPIKHGMRGTLFEDTYSDLVQGNDLFPKNLIPIASDSGGDYFCYNLESGNAGAICFYQSDYYDDPSRAVVYLAASLEKFLNSLVSDEGE